MNPLEVPCPSGVQGSPTGCQGVPNAFWDGTTCHCCGTQGTTFVGPQGCQACATDSKCGDGLGYCSGTVPQGARCIQDPNTRKWTVDCGTQGTVCEGPCHGPCGWGEWFTFSECRGTTSGNTCEASISQWKSWLFYGVIIVLLLILVIVLATIGKPSKTTKITSTNVTTTTPVMTTAVQS